LTAIGKHALWCCSGLNSLTFPHALRHVGNNAFEDCTGLTSVAFRCRVLSVSPVFIVWAVGNSRNRDNCEITTLKYTRNVLRLITVLTFERRDIASVDPDGSRGVFKGCIGLNI
jgi:hypothetical protein